MTDRITFMETLHSVQEIMRTSGEPMDRQEVMAYFKDMELSQEQEEMVYEFLQLPPEALEENVEEEPEDENEEALDTEEAAEDLEAEKGAHFQMYLDESNELQTLATEEEAKLYEKLLAGDSSVIADISTQWLKRVITIAEEYKGKGYLQDDLVQEGNIGLLMCLNDLVGNPQEENISEQLTMAVKTAIEEYMGEESGEEQQGETILAKVSLVHEARKLLKQEKGTDPSLQELVEYTKISEEEMVDILSLVKESKKI